MNTHMRPATYQDVLEVAGRLRKPDLDEIHAVRGEGFDPVRAIAQACDASDWTMAGVGDGVTFMLFGVAPVIKGNVGAPWLMTTDGVEKYRVPFLRRGHEAVTMFHKKYPMLVNYVDARNTTAIRWLRTLGFNILKPRPWGEQQLPHHEFVRLR